EERGQRDRGEDAEDQHHDKELDEGETGLTVSLEPGANFGPDVLEQHRYLRGPIVCARARVLRHSAPELLAWVTRTSSAFGYGPLGLHGYAIRPPCFGSAKHQNWVRSYRDCIGILDRRNTLRRAFVHCRNGGSADLFVDREDRQVHRDHD